MSGALRARRRLVASAAAASGSPLYVVLLVLTVVGFRTRPDRLHPGAGQGLPDRRDPAARRRVARAHRRGGAQGERDHPRHARACSSRSPSPASRARRAPTARTPARSSSARSRSRSASRTARPRPSCCTTLQQRLRHDPARRSIFVIPPPPVQGLGTAGGFKLLVQDRGGRGFACAAGGDRRARRRGAPRADARRRLHHLPRLDAAALRRRRPRQGEQARTCRWATSSTRCRSTSARSTSTTSTASAAPSRCARRPRATSAPSPTTSRS